MGYRKISHYLNEGGITTSKGNRCEKDAKVLGDTQIFDWFIGVFTAKYQIKILLDEFGTKTENFIGIGHWEDVRL